MKRKALAILLNVSLLCVILAGCAQPKKAESLPVLKIFSQPESFDFFYRDLFEAAFPELPIEVVFTENKNYFTEDNPNEVLKKAIEQTSPDLIFFTGEPLYRELAEEGKLVDLSIWLNKRDGLSTEAMHPGILERLRSNEAGQLYGLAPVFASSLLYYNQDIFDSFGIDPPGDQMSWEELLQLAMRFKSAQAAEEGIVGFHQRNIRQPLDLINHIAETEEISAFDIRQSTMTLDTPRWREVLESVVAAFQREAFWVQMAPVDELEENLYMGPEGISTADLFGQGKAAMTIASYGAYKKAKFRTLTHASPVNSSDRNRSNMLIGMFPILSIAANSQHAAQAREVMQYLNGDHAAKVAAAMPEEQTFYPIANNKIYAAYKKDPIVNKLFELMPAKAPANYSKGLGWDFYQPYNDLMNREITKVIANEQTLDEALTTIESEGNLLLKQFGD
ncbi:carbohydrate ABC transporter substrate-binding protein [Paenibacillaceae bacterium]|nr:carbohydrate ABC transporter substrate-binding protein [Paenibacillaceae bacterium]